MGGQEEFRNPGLTVASLTSTPNRSAHPVGGQWEKERVTHVPKRPLGVAALVVAACVHFTPGGGA